MRCRISSSVHDAILAAADGRATEICGLLFGRDDLVMGWNEARNVAQQPWHRFEIDPAALFAALRAERRGGPALVGYVHSHPSGLARPSPTDAAQAAPDGRLWLIAGGGRITAWRAVEGGAVHGRFDPLTLEVAEA